jgi:hypothetical protein
MLCRALEHFPSRCRDALPDEQRALARGKKANQRRALALGILRSLHLHKIRSKEPLIKWLL